MLLLEDPAPLHTTTADTMYKKPKAATLTLLIFAVTLRLRVSVTGVRKVPECTTDVAGPRHPCVWAVRAPVSKLLTLATAIVWLGTAGSALGDRARLLVGQAAHVLLTEGLATQQRRADAGVASSHTAPVAVGSDGGTARARRQRLLVGANAFLRRGLRRRR